MEVNNDSLCNEPWKQKVSAKCYGAMPERGGLSARARGAALGIAIVPPTAVKGGAS
jgi:hypothetical protein